MSVATVVKGPERVEIIGPEAGMRVLGGVVGAMVTGTARSTRTIQAIVSTLEIDITDIVRREFVEALRSDRVNSKYKQNHDQSIFFS